MRRALAAVLLTGVVAAACGDGYSDVGPLGGGPDEGSGQYCLPSPVTHEVTFGYTFLTPTAPVTLESVEIVGLKDAKLIEARVIEFDDDMSDGSTSYGSTTQYPPDPSEYTFQGGNWADSVAVPGAKLAANHGYNLMVGLTITKDGGGLDHLRLRYASGGKRYELTTTYSLMVSIDSDNCDKLMPTPTPTPTTAPEASRT